MSGSGVIGICWLKQKTNEKLVKIPLTMGRKVETKIGRTKTAIRTACTTSPMASATRIAKALAEIR